MHELLERFLRYVAYDTQANPAAGHVPSSPGQMALARQLATELEALGLAGVTVSEQAYVTAALPARNAPHAPTIGLLAHLDTACEASGAHVRPQVIDNYDGGDITLAPGMPLSPERFASLREKKGKTLIVTRGDTLLGADDKAGIAIIMSLMARLRDQPDIPHGPLRIAFVPDEEIGHGAALLDLAAFGADFAYTVDGSGHGTIEYENFNAAGAELTIRGLSIHPGHATHTMVNAVLLGQEFLNGLPKDETPARTANRQGFYHVTGFQGEVGTARVSLIIRDHDATRFAARKDFLRAWTQTLNARHPAEDGPRFTLVITDQYRNMLEKIEPHRHIVDTAVAAIRACGMEPQIRAIRGGTDGAQLSWRGLPTPNLFCGDGNAHGPYEYVALEDMNDAVNTLEHIVRHYAAQPGV